MLDNYETVAERLSRWLDMEHNGQPRVLTDMVSQPGADIAVFRAELWVDQVLVATGWAEEVRGQGNVNRTSHVENCETSAIGRALANAGVAGSDPTRRASREEMQKVERMTTTSNGPSSTGVKVHGSTRMNGGSATRPGSLPGEITEKQVGYIKGACKRDGAPTPLNLENFSKQEASDWIEAHKNGTNPNDIPNPTLQCEDPF